MIKILIVDDQINFLEETKKLFQDSEEFIIETNADVYGVHAILEKNESPYDVYLVDINMPVQNGIVLCSKIRTYQPSASIIVFTGDNIENYYPLMLNKMVDGLLSKTATKAQISRTISATVEGEILLPANFIDHIKTISNQYQAETSITLNDREKQIIEYISKGYSNSDISEKLRVSQRTVERYLTQIFNLLDVSTRSEVAEAAKERNLI